MPITAHGRPAPILLADAEDTARAFLADNLTADGYTVISVATENPGSSCPSMLSVVFTRDDGRAEWWEPQRSCNWPAIAVRAHALSGRAADAAIPRRSLPPPTLNPGSCVAGGSPTSSSNRGPAATNSFMLQNERSEGCLPTRRPGTGWCASERRGDELRCADHRVLASVGSVGDAYDNALAESFVDSFKTELIRDRVWRTRSQMELAVLEYVHWFNHDRLHESLGDVPPVEVEDAYWAAEATSPPGSSPLSGSGLTD